MVQGPAGKVLVIEGSACAFLLRSQDPLVQVLQVLLGIFVNSVFHSFQGSHEGVTSVN